MASNFTLTSWKETTTTALIEALPLQEFDSAFNLVENYLSSVGGWLPDDENDPTGFGMPVNGETPSEAASSISTNEYDRVYSTNLSFNIQASATLAENLTPSLDNDSVISSLEIRLKEWIEQQLRNTNINYIDAINITGTSEVAGNTTAQQRVVFDSEVSNQNSVDPSVITLRNVRELNNLDNFWNIHKIYTEEDKDLVYIVRKYVSVNYNSLDSNSAISFVVKVDKDNYSILTGLKLMDT